MNCKVKRFVGYLIYVITVGYIIVKADDYHLYLQHKYSKTFDTTYLWLFTSLFPILVGLLLVLPHLVSITRKQGSLNFNWIMFLAVGLPTLFIAITPIVLATGLEQLTNIWLFSSIIVLHKNLVTISGVVFGFVLITAFDNQDS